MNWTLTSGILEFLRIGANYFYISKRKTLHKVASNLALTLQYFALPKRRSTTSLAFLSVDPTAFWCF